MILSQNIYGYGSWVVIFIVLFDISKNDPLLVPYTCILKSIRARSKQLMLKNNNNQTKNIQILYNLAVPAIVLLEIFGNPAHYLSNVFGCPAY
jgi:hypothetical protein